MCVICGGSACAGTGGCSVIINHAPEVVKITGSYTGNIISTIQTYSMALLTATKEQLLNTIRYLRLKK